MKQISLTVLIFLFTGILGFAQNDNPGNEPKTLFSNGTERTGWFVDFNHSHTTLNGKYSYMPGFSAGIIMNRNFRMGIIGKSLSWHQSYLKYNNIFPEPVILEGGFAGLYFEASPKENRIIHFTFPFVAGVGGAVLKSEEKYPEIDEGEIEYSTITLSSSPFLVIEPGINVEMNVSGFLKIYAGYSHRWMPGLNLTNLSRNAFNSDNFNIGLKIGKF